MCKSSVRVCLVVDKNTKEINFPFDTLPLARNLPHHFLGPQVYTGLTEFQTNWFCWERKTQISDRARNPRSAAPFSSTFERTWTGNATEKSAGSSERWVSTEKPIRITTMMICSRWWTKQAEQLTLICTIKSIFVRIPRTCVNKFLFNKSWLLFVWLFHWFHHWYHELLYFSTFRSI